MPVVPSGHHAAPRAPGQGTAQLPVDPRHGPTPLVTERVSSAPESVISSQTSHLTVVILVILAATVAAVTVYFVLPLLT